MKLLALAVCLLVLAGCAVAYALWPRPSASDGGANAAGGAAGPRFTMARETGGNRVVIEAEAATKLEPPVRIVDASVARPAGEASGGNCCVIGPEKANESETIQQYAKGHPSAKHPGFATYELEVPATDDYTLWLRAYWVDDCGDSVGISLAGEAPLTVAGTVHGRWTWNRLGDGTGKALPLRLEAGRRYTLTVCNREDDLYWDQILLLGTDRAWPLPTGIETP